MNDSNTYSNYEVLFKGYPKILREIQRLQKLRRGNLRICCTNLSGLRADQWTTLIDFIQDNKIDNLSLSNCGLRVLPRKIGKLTAIKNLDLSENYLTVLPAEIGNLIALENLWLNKNSLTALPPEIGNLASLQVLSLTGNSLTGLPAEIGHLTALEVLWLENNSLTTLPPEIGKLTNFRSLFLRNNPCQKNLFNLPLKSDNNIVEEASFKIFKCASSIFLEKPLEKLLPPNEALNLVNATAVTSGDVVASTKSIFYTNRNNKLFDKFYQYVIGKQFNLESFENRKDEVWNDFLKANNFDLSSQLIINFAQRMTEAQNQLAKESVTSPELNAFAAPFEFNVQKASASENPDQEIKSGDLKHNRRRSI